MEFIANADVLASSGGRALGAVISKFKTLKNVGYNTSKSLFESGVLPILQYGAGIWGVKDFVDIERVQLRAIR